MNNVAYTMHSLYTGLLIIKGIDTAYYKLHCFEVIGFDYVNNPVNFDDLLYPVRGIVRVCYE